MIRLWKYMGNASNSPGVERILCNRQGLIFFWLHMISYSISEIVKLELVIVLTIQLSIELWTLKKIPHGKGLWKFNNTVLLDKDRLTYINDKI